MCDCGVRFVAVALEQNYCKAFAVWKNWSAVLRQGVCELLGQNKRWSSMCFAVEDFVVSVAQYAVLFTNLPYRMHKIVSFNKKQVFVFDVPCSFLLRFAC